MQLSALTVTCVGFLQGVLDVEGPQSSKRVAAARSGDGRKRVRDGVRVDAKWEHQTVCSATLGCESV